MCLLDEVLHWDALRIRCRSSSHRSLENPLRAHGRLGVACGIEYAMQAMAIHGALLTPVGGTAATQGYLVALHDVSLRASSLDGVAADLTATAERLNGDSRLAMYTFAVVAAERVLLTGRATLLHDLPLAISPETLSP
jgi:predicted hotdog family 3-hydroxylacyl-ACP dehydratase